MKFKNNLKDFYIVPKIIIFTKDKKLFLVNNSNIKDIIENNFYNLGGIQTLFKGVYEDFLIKNLWKKNFQIKNKCLNNNIGEQYTFEYINNKLELYLPVFYKSLIKLNEKDILEELTHYLYNSYSKNKYIKELLGLIDGIPEIPVEILCKYYARLYTIESEFYKDINKSLRERNPLLEDKELLYSADKNNNYSITFIKSFYVGIEKGCFDLDFNKKLYRFFCLAKKEFDKINEYLKNKKPGIPAINFFQKHFYLLMKMKMWLIIFMKNIRKIIGIKIKI